MNRFKMKSIQFEETLPPQIQREREDIVAEIVDTVDSYQIHNENLSEDQWLKDVLDAAYNAILLGDASCPEIDKLRKAWKGQTE